MQHLPGELGAAGAGLPAKQCGHRLHKRCVAEMRRLGGSGRCPLCREASADLTPVQVLVDRALLCWQRCSWQDAFQSASEVLDVDPGNTTAKRIYLAGVEEVRSFFPLRH